VLHLLETEVYRKVLPALKAVELLNVSGLVVSDSIPHDVFGTAEDARIGIDHRGEDFCADRDPHPERELHRPDVLALHPSVGVIRARAIPPVVVGDYIV
jgi:hypothetical protein